MTTTPNRRWFRFLRYSLVAVACIASATLVFYLVARWYGSAIRKNDREALRTYILEGRADAEFQRGRGLFSDDEIDEMKIERNRRLSNAKGRQEVVPNLTMASAETFAASVGQPVVVEGKLSVGKLGYSLLGATPQNVAFYVISRTSGGGPIKYPRSWQQRIDKKVRVSGILNFQPVPNLRTDAAHATAADYYFLVLQDATIEQLETMSP
jgi:hypothetical protein